MKALLAFALCAPTLVLAENVTVENFVRAESDFNILGNMKSFGFGVGELHHLREPTTTENQPTIRMNQDTLYSGLVVDLSKPVEITLPDLRGRYQSLHLVNQDHYMFAEAKPGTYRLTEDEVGTRFAFVAFRTFVDVTNPDDIAKAHAAQDAITTSGGGKGPYEAPDWNLDNLGVARKALSDVAVLGFNSKYAFGTKDETRPIDHLVGAAAGWGGLPFTAASYVIDSVSENDGKTPHAVTVKDVPVDAFWSITVYNANGYLEPNDMGVNSYNNFTATPDDDGAYPIHFGGCDDGRVNCIPISPGWNYAVRLYQPRAEILDGSWAFPVFEAVD
ncbi:DUF1254 domain-containing protein [Ruegeria atlantica]|uniref:DUF1254 domain-containing protein n=1 Tax=Ruegeria atlantica TaxID=81569 RepID=UPI002494F423|nr:DUF1254 domain-containing protein [Ruegeria atlantica]